MNLLDARTVMKELSLLKTELFSCPKIDKIALMKALRKCLLEDRDGIPSAVLDIVKYVSVSNEFLLALANNKCHGTLEMSFKYVKMEMFQTIFEILLQSTEFILRNEFFYLLRAMSLYNKKVLSKCGANKYGSFMLFLHVGGSDGLVKCLYDMRCNVPINGNTLCISIKNKKWELVSFLLKTPRAKMLIRYRDKYFKSPLYYLEADKTETSCELAQYIRNLDTNK